VESRYETNPRNVTGGTRRICPVAPAGEVISPTDCVKDRLSAFYHWGDRQCLAQAILVANSQTTDIEDIRQWSLGEGKLEEFKEFFTRLAHK